MKCILSCFLLTALVSMSLHAQKGALKNRFNAGIVIGANTSQIDGDNYLGYDKYGFFGGVRGIARLNTKSELVLELLYNKKGSRDPEVFFADRNTYRFLSLDYIEIPILYHRKMGNKIGVRSFEIGFSYAQLFGVKINEDPNSRDYPPFTAVREEFNKNDFAVIIGGGIFLNKHIRLMGRFTYSMTLLYKNKSPRFVIVNNPFELRYLRNMQLGLGVNYIF